MNNSSEQLHAANDPNSIKFPFDPERTPRDQIGAAIASVPPRRCKRHPDELRPVDLDATLRSALSRDDGVQSQHWHVEFSAIYERCTACPHSDTDHAIEVEDCPVGSLRIFKHLTVRDAERKPLPRRFDSARLELDRSARQQFNVWLERQADFRCQFSNQPLRRQDAHMSPPFDAWTILPEFQPCLRCGLERLGIAPDESGASFDNFRPDPPALREHLKVCRAFAAAPKGVLLLLGSCGVGKTHLAIAILREFLRRGGWGSVFTKHRHFLAQHWHAMRPVAFGDEAPESPLTRCQSSPLLVYDELSATTDTRTSEDLLLDLFEARIGHFRPTIITANLLRADLEAVLGTRLYDRLCRAAFAVLEFGFESKRPALNGEYLRRTV